MPFRFPPFFPLFLLPSFFLFFPLTNTNCLTNQPNKQKQTRCLFFLKNETNDYKVIQQMQSKFHFAYGVREALFLQHLTLYVSQLHSFLLFIFKSLIKYTLQNQLFSRKIISSFCLSFYLNIYIILKHFR